MDTPVLAATGGAAGKLVPGFGIVFADLYRRDGQRAIDAAFLRFLDTADAALRPRLEAARAGAETICRRRTSPR